MESEKNFAGAAVQRVTCLPVAEAVLEEIVICCLQSKSSIIFLKE